MSESILEQKKLRSAARRLKPGENIKYLLLLKVPNSDEKFWEIITGREEAYNYIKANIAEIDVDNSFIVANKMKEINLDDLHSVYDFVLWVKEENDIADEFDIEDYVISNNNNGHDIGVGLESAGNVFTGVAGSFDSLDDDK